MSKKVFSTITAAALAISAFGVQANSTDAAEEGFNLTIMHTNDTHANLDKQVDDETVDTIAKRVTLVKQIRKDKPHNLLLDAGDVFSGTLYFNKFFGQADLAFMNLMQYDAMVFGNHEFDLGSGTDGHQKLKEFVDGAEFPFVAANVDFSVDADMAPLENDEYTAAAENGQIYNGIIKEIDGEQVGIFGLTTEETASISSPEAIEFTDYIAAAEEAVAYFDTQDVNKIIALTHIGFDDNVAVDNDLKLAAEVPEIDVIVGGHTHKKLETPEKVGNTLIVQADQYNNFLGQLDVTFNDVGVITSYNGQLHDVMAAEVDAEAAELLKPYQEVVNEEKLKPTGAVAEVPLNGGRNEGGVRQSETNLGNLITDGMLAAAKKLDPETTIAVQNGGGIRASIDAGEITYGEVLTTMPFGNSLAIMELSGEDLKAALEISVSRYPAENGGFLHVSGLVFNFDGRAPVGERVLSVYTVQGDELVELEDDKMYKIATNTFTAKGGDGYTMFGEAYEDGRVTEPGIIDYEMFIDYMNSLDVVAPEEEGRINQIRLSGETRYETSVAVSKEGWESSKVVVIARGDQFADALTATPLAYQQDAPILLTRTNSLSEAVKAEIQRLGAERAIILGGTEAISAQVVSEVKANLSGLKYTTRIGGKDRYETAAKIASQLNGSATEAVVVSGLNYPDALSASSFAALSEMPILLTRTDRIPAYTQEALEDIESTLIVGGPVAVSKAVESKLPEASRIAGADRYETSYEVAIELFPESAVGFVANGRGFADALTGSNLAAFYEAPMLLVKPDSASSNINALASSYYAVYTVGGELAVSPEVVKELHQ